MDVFSYYIYLPALVIEKDLKLTFQGKVDKPNYEHLWYVPDPNGNKLTKMGIGISYLYSPFFFIGHYIAPKLNYVKDGFSKPYMISLILGSIFYALCGLFILSRILLLFFSDLISAITIILIGLGTNMLSYATLEPLMPHVYNFFLISLFIYLTVKWHKNPTYLISALIGLVFGIIAVARPTNAIIIIFPLLYSVFQLEDLKYKINLIINNYKKLLLSVLFFLIPVIPQLLYWQHVTGNLFYYSYNEEWFYFTNPKILDGLIGFRKGWLIYTPMMIFGLLGIYFVYKKLPQFFLSILLFTLINIYVVYSWWCWWYGGSFSSRPMIDSYAVLAISLACFINFFYNKKNFSRKIILGIATAFIMLNVFQTYQYKNNLLHYDSMTKELYFAIFGRLSTPSNYKKLLDQPDYENAKKTGKELNKDNGKM